MSHGFNRRRGRIIARLQDAEREVLRSLLEQTAQLLQQDEPDPQPQQAGDQFEEMMRRAGFGGSGAAAATPHDPAVRRLLPDGHHDDPAAAAEFRRLTSSSVRDRKLTTLRAAVGAVEAARGDELDLDEPTASALLVALTDVRLVLGERLALRTDDDADAIGDMLAALDQDDPRFGLALAYEFLTWLQETLATALLPR